MSPYFYHLVIYPLIVPNRNVFATKVFAFYRKGDYCRYKAEYLNDDANRKISSEVSEGSYKAAYDIAVKELSTTNPIRLGLALNFSVFHFEIKNDAEQACKLAKAVTSQ